MWLELLLALIALTPRGAQPNSAATFVPRHRALLLRYVTHVLNTRSSRRIDVPNGAARDLTESNHSECLSAAVELRLSSCLARTLLEAAHSRSEHGGDAINGNSKSDSTRHDNMDVQLNGGSIDQQRSNSSAGSASSPAAMQGSVGGLRLWLQRAALLEHLPKDTVTAATAATAAKAGGATGKAQGADDATTNPRYMLFSLVCGGGDNLAAAVLHMLDSEVAAAATVMAPA